MTIEVDIKFYKNFVEVMKNNIKNFDKNRKFCSLARLFSKSDTKENIIRVIETLITIAENDKERLEKDSRFASSVFDKLKRYYTNE